MIEECVWVSGDKTLTPRGELCQPSETQEELYMPGPGFCNPSLAWVVDS